MKKIYIQKLSHKINRVLTEHYENFLWLVRREKSDAEYIQEHPTYYQAYLLFALVEEGYIDIEMDGTLEFLHLKLKEK